MNERQHHLVKVIQKIEIFSGFDHTDVQRLLKICRFKSYASGEDVYKRGDASDEMLLVLRGMMLVLGEDGKGTGSCATWPPYGGDGTSYRTATISRCGGRRQIDSS